jgi:hypothetical protein
MRIYLFLLFNLLCSGYAIAQANNKVSGTVKDSLNRALPGAYVRVIYGADTLNAVTDFRGKFSFSGITASGIILNIRGMGYMPFETTIQFQKGQKYTNIPYLLQRDKSTLKEVVITTRVIPVRILKDTVEYNAAAFLIRENDRVDELLKQLPGLRFDREGRLISMGQITTRLRINGEDFFTNNVKDYINQLPADIISKVQIVNDYGDEANFTGNKTGEAQKMLNLVTKPGRGKGNFGNTSINSGTNERYGLQTNGNLWREKKQIGFKGNINSTNNPAGINRNISTGLNYRDKLSDALTSSLAYSFDNNRNDNHQLDYIETLNPLGTLYTLNDNNRTTVSNRHNLNWNLQSIGKKSYIQATVSGNFLNSTSEYRASSLQTGVNKQDLLNNSFTAEGTPEVSGSFAFSRRLKKAGRTISLGITAKNASTDTDDDLDSRITYYNPRTGLFAKDSLLNRLMETKNRLRSLSGTLRYSEPLSNDGDSVVSKNLDIFYTYSMEENANDLLTMVDNVFRRGRIVDSLSTIYTSRFTSHLLGVNFRYGAEDLSYSFGLTGQPNLLNVLNKRPRSEINHIGFNVTPVANISYNVSDRTSLTFLYNGNSMAPNFAQLQPVPNTKNLQNIIIGNPNLKSTFNQMASLSYQNSNLETGRAFMFGINGNIIQNQVVSNVILRRDTLNSLKQETTFLNANGAYNFDGIYSWSKPFIDNIVNLEFRGSVGFGNTVSYSDDVLNENKGFNFSQAMLIRMSKKALSITGDASYNYNSNRYTLGYSNLKNIQIYEFNLSTKATLTKGLIVGFDALKRINIGYAIEASNPTIINMSLEKSFLKRERGTFKIQAYDILNQGNYFIRNVSDNSIIDSRNNQNTRYLQLSININLQQFGG